MNQLTSNPPIVEEADAVRPASVGKLLMIAGSVLYYFAAGRINNVQPYGSGTRIGQGNITKRVATAATIRPLAEAGRRITSAGIAAGVHPVAYLRSGQMVIFSAGTRTSAARSIKASCWEESTLLKLTRSYRKRARLGNRLSLSSTWRKFRPTVGRTCARAIRFRSRKPISNRAHINEPGSISLPQTLTLSDWRNWSRSRMFMRLSQAC